MVVAAVAHNGQFRLNDIEYFNHPLAVAKILSTAVHGLPNWNKRVQNKSALWLRMLQYEALNHDAFENELPDHKDESLRGTSFLEEKNLLASPLFHQRLLESYLKEEDKPMAAEAAHDIYLLSKPVGPDGHITNDRYMHRLKGHSKALLVKLGDITHNLKIDPKLKPIRNRKKRAKWKDNRQEYRRNIRFIYKTLWFSRASLSEKRLAGRITTVDKYRLEVFESSRLLSQFTSSELVAEYSQCEDKDTSQGNGDSLD